MPSISIDRNGFLANVFLTRKGACRAASTSTLTLSGEQTVDGVALVAEDRVLVKDQSNAVENGCYIVKTAEWERSKDFNQRGHADRGTTVVITDGTVNEKTEWMVTTTGDPVPGQEAIAFVQYGTTTDLPTHIADPTDAHDASAISFAPTGGIAATDVQAAIVEVAADAQPLDADLTAIAALSRTRGDIIRGGASAWERLALGTSGYHIVSDGTDAAWAGFLQAGTGASTRTWQAKARDIIHVADFGAVGDGTTNDTAAIQAAIDYAESIGGAKVNLDAKVYSVTALVNDSSGVKLVGAATGRMFTATPSQTLGTILRARAGTTTLLTTSSPSAGSSAIAAGGVENLILDGNGIATRSLFIKSLTNFTYRNLVIGGATTAQFETGVVSEAFAGLNYVYSCAFENLWIHAGSGSAKGMVLSGDPGDPGGNRTVFCSFKHVHITHDDGTALEINDADSNSFYNVGISREAGGTGTGIHLIGTDADAQDLVHSNHFFFVHAGPGGWLSDGDQAINNVVFGLATEDGVPVTISNASELWYVKDDGDFLLSNGLMGGLTTAPVTHGSITPTLAVAGSGVASAQYSADGAPALVILAKSRNATVGSHTVVQAGDTVGDVRFEGSDGSQFVRAAMVRAVVDTTPGSSDMPGRIGFWTTPDGTAAPVERLRCDAPGNVIAPYNTAALSTAATNGLIYVPTSTAASTAAPIGTPTSYTGMVPLLYNTAQNRLWIYNSAWRSVALTT